MDEAIGTEDFKEAGRLKKALTSAMAEDLVANVMIELKVSTDQIVAVPVYCIYIIWEEVVLCDRVSKVDEVNFCTDVIPTGFCFGSWKDKKATISCQT